MMTKLKTTNLEGFWIYPTPTIKVEDISNLTEMPTDVQELIKSADKIEVRVQTLEGIGTNSWSALFDYWSEDDVKEQKQYNPSLKVGYKITSIGSGKDGINWNNEKVVEIDNLCDAINFRHSFVDVNNVEEECRFCGYKQKK